jgi:hypothetical protein
VVRTIFGGESATSVVVPEVVPVNPSRNDIEFGVVGVLYARIEIGSPFVIVNEIRAVSAFQLK